MESQSDLAAYPNGDSDGPMPPGSPYRPGMRSSSGKFANPDDRRGADFDKAPAGSIQMQNFSEGQAPPPPVAHSWKRIDRWLEDHYVELFDNLSEGCTQNDINELEHALDCTLPLEVRESLMVHDGQERGGLPSGLLFGCMLLDCEEIVEEWSNWQRVGAEFFSEAAIRAPPPAPSTPAKALGGMAATGSSAAGPSSAAASPTGANRPTSPAVNWRAALAARQRALPAHSIRSAYTSPHWIPLARDWGGNCIAVDLAPGPAGKYGQVILFGRDFDTKILVSRSWSTFLASVADDFDAGKAEILPPTEAEEYGGGGALAGSDAAAGQLRLREFKRRPNNATVDPPFLDILRWRAEMRYGARRRPNGPPGKKPSPGGPGMRGNPNRSPSGLGGSSPYSSPNGRPSDPGALVDRGRSPSRFAGKGAAGGAGRAPMSSPLARVAEEANLPPPVKIMTDGIPVGKEKLISVDTPRASGELNAADLKDLVDVKDEEPSTDAGVGKEAAEPVPEIIDAQATVGLGLDLPPTSPPADAKTEKPATKEQEKDAKDVKDTKDTKDTKDGGELEVVEI